jgi:hypothetical protein
MRVLVVVVLAISLAAVALAYRSRGPGDLSSTIAARIGADGCALSGYHLPRSDGSKTPIYDCSIAGDHRCFVERDGVQRDATARVRVLFADELAGSRPICVG